MIKIETKKDQESWNSHPVGQPAKWNISNFQPTNMLKKMLSAPKWKIMNTFLFRELNIKNIKKQQKDVRENKIKIPKVWWKRWWWGQPKMVLRNGRIDITPLRSTIKIYQIESLFRISKFTPRWGSDPSLVDDPNKKLCMSMMNAKFILSKINNRKMQVFNLHSFIEILFKFSRIF